MSQVLPPDPERAKIYESMSPKVAKTLMADGSVMAVGAQILPPCPERAALYESYAPSVAKYLMPDGSVTDVGGDGFGVGGTVRWFADLLERDAYYSINPEQLRNGISVGVGDPVIVYTFDGVGWLLGALAFKGDKGDRGEAPTYIHNQSTATKDWSIQHNLGSLAVSAVVIDNDGNEVLGFIDRAASTMNLLIIRFGKTISGTAYIRS